MKKTVRNIIIFGIVLFLLITGCADKTPPEDKNLSREYVYEGWLVRDSAGGMAYIPDPHREWILNDSATVSREKWGILSDSVIKPVRYKTFNPVPTVGQVFNDPVFGTPVKRITNNAEQYHKHVLGGYFSNSEICYFNCDGSYFVAAEVEESDNKTTIVTNLYDGNSGTKIHRIGLYKDIEPYFLRWPLDKHICVQGRQTVTDPVKNVLFINGNSIFLIDLNTGGRIVLREFAEYNKIGTAGGEGDVSDDGRLICLDGDGKELFVYDLVEGKKYPASHFDLGSLGAKGKKIGVDYAAVSPKGNYVVVSWAKAGMGERYHGIEVYSKKWEFLRQIYPGIIHWEVGVDAYGDEVAYTAIPSGFKEYYKNLGVKFGDIVSIRLADGNIRLLKSIPKWAHFAMSACNSVTDGSVLYVSYAVQSDNPDSLWYPFHGEIFELATDGSGTIRRFVHHGSKPVEGKTDKYTQADLVVDRQGTKILYRSVYNYQIGDLYFFNIFMR